MNPTIIEYQIREIIENTDLLLEIIGKPTKIKLINESDNIIFKLEGNKVVFAKIGLAGWEKYEYEVIQQLYSKKYVVPEAISYVPLLETSQKDLNFGNLKREVGILFYFPLEGTNLKQNLTKINIRNALNFLKKLHEDKSLKIGLIDNYQKVEVDRGLKYIKKLFKGKMAEKLQELMKNYEKLKIDFCCIHGGPRLEHFIFNNNQMGMIDFEGACMGDPFKDLGIFFIELLSTGTNKEELTKHYFNRNLSTEERIRLRFFELRALLVKKFFEPNKEILDDIKKVINNSE